MYWSTICNDSYIAVNANQSIWISNEELEFFSFKIATSFVKDLDTVRFIVLCVYHRIISNR